LAVSGQLARSHARVSIRSKETEVPALGAHRLHVNGVRREAQVEPRLLIDYFLRESFGLTNIVKAIQSAAGTRRAPGGA